MTASVDEDFIEIYELGSDWADILNRLIATCEEKLLMEETVDVFLDISPSAKGKILNLFLFTQHRLLMLPSVEPTTDFRRIGEYRGYVLSKNVERWKLEMRDFILADEVEASPDAHMTLEIVIGPHEPITMSADGPICRDLFRVFKNHIIPNMGR